MAREPSGPATQVDHRQGWGFIDEHRHVLHPADRAGQPRPVVIVEAPRAQSVAVDPTDRTEHPRRQLACPHLHGEHRDRQAGLERDVFTEIQTKRSLTHRWAARDDDEITTLQTRGHAVEIGITRRYAGDVTTTTRVIELADPCQHLAHETRDVGETRFAASAFFRNPKNRRLGFIEQLPRLATLRIECIRRNFVRRRNQSTQGRSVSNDLGITPHVCRRGCLGRK